MTFIIFQQACNELYSNTIEYFTITKHTDRFVGYFGSYDGPEVVECADSNATVSQLLAVQLTTVLLLVQAYGNETNIYNRGPPYPCRIYYQMAKLWKVVLLKRFNCIWIYQSNTILIRIDSFREANFIAWINISRILLWHKAWPHMDSGIEF